jgi:copper chaperone CopZ
MHRRAFLQIVEMHVSIDCDGCEDNVRKALEKLKGARIDRPCSTTNFSLLHARTNPAPVYLSIAEISMPNN